MTSTASLNRTFAAKVVSTPAWSLGSESYAADSRGGFTVTETSDDSGVSSDVHTAPSASQSVVLVSATGTGFEASAATVTSHRASSSPTLDELLQVPSVTVSASHRPSTSAS